MRPGGSSLPLRCRHRHFTLCKEKRLLVLTEHLPWAEPMGPCGSGAARGARGVSETFPTATPPHWEALGQVRGLWDQLCSPPAGSEGARGTGTHAPPQLGDVLCRADPRDARGDVAPAPTHSLPLLLGTAPACPRLLAFPAVPTLGHRGCFPFFLPTFVPRAVGSPARTSQGAGAAPAEYHHLK